MGARVLFTPQVVVGGVVAFHHSLPPGSPAQVSEDGILRFELVAPPHSQQELALAYTVSSSSKVAGL